MRGERVWKARDEIELGLRPGEVEISLRRFIQRTAGPLQKSREQDRERKRWEERNGEEDDPEHSLFFWNENDLHGLSNRSTTSLGDASVQTLNPLIES